MDNDFISFGRDAEEEEEELSSSEQEEEDGDANPDDTEYNIEDILKRTAVSLKKQLDRLELKHADHISLGGEQTHNAVAAAATGRKNPRAATEPRLETGFEKLNLYLQEHGNDESLPAAVTLKSSKNLQREIKKPRAPRGKNWGFMRAPRLTKARRLEYKVILLRSQLDPKRRYKRLPDEIPKVFQFGRVVSGAGDFYSGRMTRKERRNTLVEELLADRDLRQRAKRKYKEIESERMSGRGGQKKRKMDRMPKWKQKMEGGDHDAAVYAYTHNGVKHEGTVCQYPERPLMYGDQQRVADPATSTPLGALSSAGVPAPEEEGGGCLT